MTTVFAAIGPYPSGQDGNLCRHAIWDSDTGHITQRTTSLDQLLSALTAKERSTKLPQETKRVTVLAQEVRGQEILV
jgi:hypothetical protein